MKKGQKNPTSFMDGPIHDCNLVVDLDSVCNLTYLLNQDFSILVIEQVKRKFH